MAIVTAPTAFATRAATGMEPVPVAPPPEAPGLLKYWPQCLKQRLFFHRPDHLT